MLTTVEAPAASFETAPMRVIDLRGTREPVPSPSVLVDPTGRRARRLRVAGRVLGSLFLLWLCGLLLAGLGLLPVSDVPFAGSIRAAQEPAQLTELPSPRPGSAADLRPARPLASLSDAAGSVASGARDGAAAARRGGRASGRGGSGAGAVTRRNDAAHARGNGSARGTSSSPGTPTASPGKSGSTPSATGTTPSSSSTGPGNGKGGGSTGTTSGGGSVQGQSTAPHGSSDSAPGHDPTRTTGHGKPSV
jgi:hypothetical protein